MNKKYRKAIARLLELYANSKIISYSFSYLNAFQLFMKYGWEYSINAQFIQKTFKPNK